ncbi:MAG: FAD-dependent oxidoreductase, partial [Nitrospirota bacterium]|nr:FAD-dependent oxidoreductase [Nitrospirota bacterium]
ARHFMFPYNEKLWQTKAADMTADWVSWSVPRPEPEEVINGALGLNNRAFGYNPTFMYPVQGGIELLPKALASQVSGIQKNKEAMRIDPVRRTVHFSDGTTEHYDSLVSTLPLKELFKIIEGVPDALADAVCKLSCTSLLDINIGIAREGAGDGRHWFYIPEPEFPFYRVGFSSNFSRSVAPAGTSTMYIEVAHMPENPLDHQQTLEIVLKDFVKSGMLTPDDNVIATDIVDIPYAYVVYDRHRQKVLPEAFSWLESLSIFSVGRYGAWIYGSMEDAILQGKEVAEKIQRVQLRQARQ